ncbi:MAG TPA: deoxyribodipyrimidine photo-lyase [Xanthomonadales bacterium]|nr:deoxyribodipyrimidine photo-lyase [Xanthomonadales bacterium]
MFRNDLRIQDNPALAAAVRTGRPVIALYIHAPDEEGEWAPGPASNWWLHHALLSLRGELLGIGLPLLIRSGSSLDTLRSVARQYQVRTVYWNRRAEPAAATRDEMLGKALRNEGLEAMAFNASLLFEPHQIQNRSGQAFKVFTPFWKHLRTLEIEAPVAVDTARLRQPESRSDSPGIEALGLLPDSAWDRGFHAEWKPDLAGAGQALAAFVESTVTHYHEQRDLPAADGTSRLSPYLHFGQLGPRQVWHAVQESSAAHGQGAYAFLSELAWREFAHHLLHHFPHTPNQALSPAYRNFPWQPDAEYLSAWQRGMTGYPMVDAGMRQLWQTGWMHNRLRMVTGSFLVKHLLQPWQQGARWFWKTLVDADLANNTMGWQWLAGCGADAAPYFRIFNPILQGEKFDPGGDYVRRFVPELASLPDKYIHQPWKAPAGVLKEAGVQLGSDYPEPIISHRHGRERALQALAENKARTVQASDT